MRIHTKKVDIFFKSTQVNNKIKERCCTKCSTWKPETEEYFYMRNKKKPEKGFQAECKECVRERSKKYQAEHIKQALQTITFWQQEHREETLGYMRKFYQENKEDRREYVKKWVKNNPQRAKEFTQAHRNHDITNNEWNSCKEYFNNSCAYCGLPIDNHLISRNNNIINMDLHKEHVDDNGANDIRNCVPSCQSCNSIKNIKTIEELLESELIAGFNQDKYNKIVLWITKEYNKYIEDKPPYRIIRKQNEGLTTYHFELWTVNEYRDIIECIAIADKKKGLQQYIKM